jgi:hypothetical protein
MGWRGLGDCQYVFDSPMIGNQGKQACGKAVCPGVAKKIALPRRTGPIAGGLAWWYRQTS